MPEVRTILVIKHMSSQNPGIFRQLAVNRGIRFFEIDLHAGDPLPDPAHFDAVWVMGGTMNVWEEDAYPWLAGEKAMIRRIVHDLDTPYLGICLGHQLLADALGGEVCRGREFEIGSYPIQPTEQGRRHPLLAGLCWHVPWANVHIAEVSMPPECARVLARSEHCSNHAMAIGDRVFSVQFHPEVCETTLAGWLQIPGITAFLLDLMGETGFRTFRHDIEANRPRTSQGALRLFDNWLGLVFPENGRNA